MRLMVVATLSSPVATAMKIAMERGAKITHVENCADATAALRAGKGADLMIVDAAFDIASMIAANEAERICIPVVACAIGADPLAAARAIRAGAKEFLPLPPDPELIAAILSAASDDRAPLIFADRAMHAVMTLADQIADSDASILITGESGVGKEVMARYVHAKSRRSHAPFIAINCAAIPEHLLESELFGHEKGAFTGAVARRIGKFEEAEGGALLLDEISEMDLKLQAKLLRALQERVIDRVGGQKPVPVNIRVLATSNRDLAQAAADGEFRQDLLYRLNVVNLKIPPLRERPADIPELARHFVAKYAAANNLNRRELTSEALALIVSHPWHGNVRELENAMHRAVLLARGPEIGPEAIRTPEGSEIRDVNAHSRDPAGARPLVGRTVAEVEQDLILETLTHCLGNRTHAANILGISIRTLRNKLRLYTDQGAAVPPPPNSAAA